MQATTALLGRRVWVQAQPAGGGSSRHPQARQGTNGAGMQATTALLGCRLSLRGGGSSRHPQARQGTNGAGMQATTALLGRRVHRRALPGSRHLCYGLPHGVDRAFTPWPRRQ